MREFNRPINDGSFKSTLLLIYFSASLITEFSPKNPAIKLNIVIGEPNKEKTKYHINIICANGDNPNEMHIQIIIRIIIMIPNWYIEGAFDITEADGSPPELVAMS